MAIETTNTGDDEMAGVAASAAAATPAQPQPQRSGGTSPLVWLFGFLLVAGLLVFHLFVDFRGLSVAKGMQQAQVARELARGNGFRTLIMEPLTLMRADAVGDELSLKTIPASGIGPLNPLINAGLIKVAGLDHPVEAKRRVHFLDRLIAATASVFFLAAVAVAFFLVRRLFDNTIAMATALLLLLSDLLWRYSLSGLPHLLALLLTMLALSALTSAIDAWQQQDRSPIKALLICGLCSGLLILALPLAASLVVGLACFVAFWFRKRKALSVYFVLAVLLVVAPWCARNAMTPGSGGILGIAEARLSSQAGVASEARILRTYDAHDALLSRVNLLKKLPQQLGVQLAGLWEFTGGAIAALLFFVSLLHRFRSPLAATLRWALLLAWLCASFGMALAGLDQTRPVDSAALHILFLPLFSAYGVAFVAVLWNRNDLARDRFSLWKHAHWIALVILTAAPMALNLPGRLILAEGLGGRLVHWPPFDAFTIGKIGEWTEPEALIASDLPEAVAWYADRTVLRLPTTPRVCSTLFDRARSEELKPAGIYLSAASVDGRLMSDIVGGDNKSWAALIMRTEPDAKLAEFLKANQLQHRLNLSPSSNQRAWFLANRAYWQENTAN